jgi:hypothetical protein
MKPNHHTTLDSFSESTSSREPAEGHHVPWKSSLAIVVAISGLATFILVTFPVVNGPFTVLASKLGLPGVTQHFPKGQLQADAKTFVAKLEWLFLPNLRPAAPGGMPPTNQPPRQLSAVCPAPRSAPVSGT